MSADIPVQRFVAVLREALIREHHMVPYVLSPEDLQGAAALQRGVYDTWEWNYGASPAYNIRREQRIDGCGKLEIHMNVERGVIIDIAFFGDYFGSEDSGGLANLLRGRRLERIELQTTLAVADIGAYFHNLDLGRFLDILLD
jgi:lipoate-protein ligase A